MEVSIFPHDSVRAEKVKFIEARLHSDTKDLILRKRIKGLIETVAKSKAQPIYVAMDPRTEVEIHRFNGMVTRGPEEFAEFLADMAAAIGTSL